MKARKKVCPMCGQKLWLRDFYTSKEGWKSTYCKDCARQKRREEYSRNRKVKDGLYQDRVTGRIMEHKGVRTSIHLSAPMAEKLRRLFPATKNEDCAIEMGVSMRTVVRWARKLGLEKNEYWLHKHHIENCATMRILNKCRGNAGMIKSGEHKNPAGEFKKKNL